MHDNNGPKSTLKRLAFDTSLVISYSRPFIRNKDADGKLEYSLLTEIIISELMTQDEILQDFRYLTKEDILACLSYAADREKRLMVVEA